MKFRSSKGDQTFDVRKNDLDIFFSKIGSIHISLLLLSMFFYRTYNQGLARLLKFWVQTGIGNGTKLFMLISESTRYSEIEKFRIWYHRLRCTYRKSINTRLPVKVVWFGIQYRFSPILVLEYYWVSTSFVPRSSILTVPRSSILTVKISTQLTGFVNCAMHVAH